MKEKDAAIIKVLSDIGYADEPELTPEQEKQFERALDPEKQFLHDVEKLFTPQVQEDAWDDAETRRTTPNPLPIGDENLLNRVFDMGDDLESKRVAEYRATKKYANAPFPELARKVREELGTMMDVPISQVVALEKYLDGEHLRALVHHKPTTNASGVITLIKYQDKYYIQDGTHRIAAAAFRDEETINALVIDVNNHQEIDESTWAEEDGVRDRENPLPVADTSRLGSISSNAEYIYQKTADEYGEVSIENLEKIGEVEDIPVSQIIGSEDFLDGEHINALVHGDIPSDDVVMAIKMRDNHYYLLDGNHKAAAALIRGDKNIKALVFDISSI